MTYSTTITQKGQITIPKVIRDALRMAIGQKISLELEKDKKEVRMRVFPDILEIAGTIKVKKNKGVDPVKAREYMETHYERA
ncbi:MAG: AbrB/MazE/SpoVT family DNA-binding domain-containing protein [bacterium]